MSTDRVPIPDKWPQDYLIFFAGIISASAGRKAIEAAFEQVNAGLTETQRAWLRMGQSSTVRVYFLSVLEKIEPHVPAEAWNETLAACRKRWEGNW